jgi:hypothetical protein
MRAVVRVPLDLDATPPFPEAGFSLYEEGKPFGEEKGWKLIGGFVDQVDPARVDLLLEN